MRRVLATTVLLFAWLCANGALLDAMQVFAWARMFAGYSHTMTWSAAWRQTFDPAKPCELCLGVAKAKQTQQQQAPATNEQQQFKFVLTLHVADAPVFADVPVEWPSKPAVPIPQRSDPVPQPPPRV